MLVTRELLETVWKKKKILITSLFLFSFNVINPIKGFSYTFITFNFFVFKCFQFSSGNHHFLLFFSHNVFYPIKDLDWSKMKTFADNKINVNEKLKFGLERVENMVGKGENAGY